MEHQLLRQGAATPDLSSTLPSLARAMTPSPPLRRAGDAQAALCGGARRRLPVCVAGGPTDDARQPHVRASGGRHVRGRRQPRGKGGGQGRRGRGGGHVAQPGRAPHPAGQVRGAHRAGVQHERRVLEHAPPQPRGHRVQVRPAAGPVCVDGGSGKWEERGAAGVRGPRSSAARAAELAPAPSSSARPALPRPDSCPHPLARPPPPAPPCPY